MTLVNLPKTLVNLPKMLVYIYNLLTSILEKKKTKNSFLPVYLLKMLVRKSYLIAFYQYFQHYTGKFLDQKKSKETMMLWGQLSECFYRFHN